MKLNKILSLSLLATLLLGSAASVLSAGDADARTFRIGGKGRIYRY